MTDLRIADAPEIALEYITGNEKVPTGGYGNSAVTITNIGQFAKTALALATETYVSNAVGQKENKISFTGINLVPNATYAEIPQTNNSVLNSIHQDLLDRMEWIKDNVAVVTDHQALTNRSTFNTHPSSSISHNGTSNVSIEIEELKNDVLTINTETIPELENSILGKQDVIVNDANLNPVSALSNVPSTNNTAINLSLQAIMNRDEFRSIHNNLSGRDVPNSHPASSIQDDSGVSQQELNNSKNSILKTGAKPFTDYTNSIDAAPFIQSFANSLNDGETIEIPKGKWAIKTPCIINKNLNYVGDGELVIFGGTSGVFRVQQDPSYILTGSDLSQLPKKGDTKLYLTNPNLFNSSEYFVSLVSTEVEIVRIGYADPYYKNETLEFIDSNLNFRGQIDLDYNDSSKLTINVYKKRQRTNVKLNLSYQPFSGQTTDLKMLEFTGDNNTNFDLFINRSNSKNISGISFRYLYCSNFVFNPSCTVQGGQSDNGDSYAFLNIASSYITHYHLNYFDSGITSKVERGYAGRHGKYVIFENCKLNGIDDHFGHHYIIRNTDFLNRGIGFSGGSLLVENCNQYSPTEPLVQLRTDTPYADGDLIIRNCYTKTSLLGASSANNVSYNSKYKSWDSILIEDCKFDLKNSHMITIGTFYTQNTNFKTNKIEIRNNRYTRSSTGTGMLISTGGSDYFVDIFIIDGLYSTDGVKSSNRMIFAILANMSIILRKIPDGIDGLFKSPAIDISDNVKLGYSSTQSVTLIGTQYLDISRCNISDDALSYTSNSEQGEINLFNNKINTSKFFTNSFINNAISCGFGNKVNVNIGFLGDLRNYQKTKNYRFVTTSYPLPALSLGAATPIQTSTLSGVRLGDSVDSSFITSMNGLRINCWVSASDEIKWYIENPSNNPFGATTSSTVTVKFNARSI